MPVVLKFGDPFSSHCWFWFYVCVGIAIGAIFYFSLTRKRGNRLGLALPKLPTAAAIAAVLFAYLWCCYGYFLNRYYLMDVDDHNAIMLSYALGRRQIWLRTEDVEEMNVTKTWTKTRGILYVLRVKAVDGRCYKSLPEKQKTMQQNLDSLKKRGWSSVITAGEPFD